jgi:ubiquinone/menaquinone biosynthesis C-methylase UbiE
MSGGRRGDDALEARVESARGEERTRLREVYEARDAAMPRAAWRDNIYHPRHPLGRLFHENNHDALVAALNAIELDLEGKRVLDVGCGWGQWLRRLVDLGADPALLTGIDLSSERIEAARASNPAIDWVQHDADALPFPDAHFDIVMQVVVFSSILDSAERESLALEMLRVVRPCGHIIFVDHKHDKGDRLVGFTADAVRRYFGGSRIVYSDSVHPRYFRKLAYSRPGLARMLYRLTRCNCDSSFLVLEAPQ